MERFIMEAQLQGEHAACIRVLLATDARMCREGLESALRAAPGVDLVASAESAAEAVERARELEPAVVLVDMAMADAFFAARQITRLLKGTKVVALGVPEVESDVLTCAEIGIAGYVTRSGSINDVIDAIHAAARGEVCCSPRVAGFLFRRIAALASERGPSAGTAPGLTAREAQILRLLQQGLSNKMISRHLGIELPTVKNHVHSILTKLGVHRRAEVISLLAKRSDAEVAENQSLLQLTPK